MLEFWYIVFYVSITWNTINDLNILFEYAFNDKSGRS